LTTSPKRTTNLRRLRNIAANPAVSIVADHYTDDWGALWWARADGTAVILTAAEDRAVPLRWLMAKYHQYRDTVPVGPIIDITVAAWSGWAFTASPASEPLRLDIQA
jgi:PPOX class probable F420-dependent enzyme